MAGPSKKLTNKKKMFHLFHVFCGIQTTKATSNKSLRVHQYYCNYKYNIIIIANIVYSTLGKPNTQYQT